MLYRNCIEKLLQLKDVIVTNIECSGEEMHIHLRMEQRLHRCPQCGTLTSKVHDYRIQLDNIFRISEPLNKAYALKQQFEYVKASTSREEAAKRLSRWIMDAQRSGLKDMIKISLTYQNWSIEILNSFEYPYTNGYIEGCNNRIKVLKRVSFGMPRFVRFRRRIMHIMVD